MTVKSKFFLKYFIPVLLLTSSILLALSYTEVKTELKTIKLRELNTVLLKENSLKNHLSNIITDLIYLISHYDLHDFLVDGNQVSEKRVQDGFLLISETRYYYDQIRFIDNLGMEVIRVNNNDGTPEIVPKDKLQSKSERYYVRESLKLDPGQIYASPFDLNIENGTIEQPIKPMIRLGMPVFDRTGNNRGIVVINYRGQLLLEELNNLPVNSQNGISEDPTWLLNSEGYWLKGSSSEEEWSFMYPDRSEISFKESFPKEWRIISKTQNGQIHNNNGLTTYSTIYPFVNRFNTDKQSKMITKTSNYYWKIVSFIPSEIVHKSILKVLWKYILIYILILVILIPGILFLTTEQLRVKESEQNLKNMLVKRNLFQRSLLKIYQSEFNNMEEGIGDIIKMSHDLLDIDLLSVWLFNKEKTSITCIKIPGTANPHPHRGKIISTDKYPVYFGEILSGNQIVADNANKNHYTKIFKDVYLEPFGIFSMLDSPILNQGNVVGTFCLASTKKRSPWSTDELDFAMQIAITIATLIETMDRKKAERDLIVAVNNAERANRVKSEFLANMSHEIRTPMNAILGFSDLLLEKASEGEEKDYLNAINTSGKSLLYLINDILDLSKIEADKVEIINNPVNIISILNEMEGMFSKILKDKNLVYTTEISENIVKDIELDETRFRQILLNVIGNGVKFTESGYIKISANSTISKTNPDNIDLTIWVEDSGIGIPLESREHIFNSFEQAGKGNNTRYGGTGLGLAITKKLMQLMNGSIDLVAKKTPGALFRLIFFNIKSV